NEGFWLIALQAVLRSLHHDGGELLFLLVAQLLLRKRIRLLIHGVALFGESVRIPLTSNGLDIRERVGVVVGLDSHLAVPRIDAGVPLGDWLRLLSQHPSCQIVIERRIDAACNGISLA